MAYLIIFIVKHLWLGEELQKLQKFSASNILLHTVCKYVVMCIVMYICRCICIHSILVNVINPWKNKTRYSSYHTSCKYVLLDLMKHYIVQNLQHSCLNTCICIICIRDLSIGE